MREGASSTERTGRLVLRLVYVAVVTIQTETNTQRHATGHVPRRGYITFREHTHLTSELLKGCARGMPDYSEDRREPGDRASDHV